MDNTGAGGKDWLRLSEAAEYVGVHFTTLRRWADLKIILHIKTPGGRRRFRKSDLDQFLIKSQHGPETKVIPPNSKDIGTEIIKEIKQLGIPQEPWYGQLSQNYRMLMAQSGRLLIGSLMQYVSRVEGGEQYLNQGKDLGRKYGVLCLQAGLSEIQTIQTFVNIRHSIVDSWCEAGMVVQDLGKDTWNIYRRMNHFLDTVMIAILEAFQNRDLSLSQLFE